MFGSGFSGEFCLSLTTGFFSVRKTCCHEGVLNDLHNLQITPWNLELDEMVRRNVGAEVWDIPIIEELYKNTKHGYFNDVRNGVSQLN